MLVIVATSPQASFSLRSDELTGNSTLVYTVVPVPCYVCELHARLINYVCIFPCSPYSNYNCCSSYTPSSRWQTHPHDSQLWTNAKHMHGVQQLNLLQW